MFPLLPHFMCTHTSYRSTLNYTYVLSNHTYIYLCVRKNMETEETTVTCFGYFSVFTMSGTAFSSLGSN